VSPFFDCDDVAPRTALTVTDENCNESGWQRTNLNAESTRGHGQEGGGRAVNREYGFIAHASGIDDGAIVKLLHKIVSVKNQIQSDET